MREYGQIQCAFWNSADAMSLSDQGKLFATYLMTGPHSNGLGCYRLPDGYVMGDLGWSSETVSERFTELLGIRFAYRCQSTQFLLIPAYLRWNPVPNPNSAKARVKEFDAVPTNSSIYQQLCESLERFGNHWPNGFANRLANGRGNKNKPNQTKTNHVNPPYQEGNQPRLIKTTVGGGS